MQWLLNFFNWLFGIKKENGMMKIETVDYLVNDPSTGLVIKVAVPTSDKNLKFGCSGRADPLRTSNVFVTVVKGINNAQRFRAAPIRKWAACRHLLVVPEAGRMFNAYYDRRSLKFFWDVVGDKKIFLADSTDVVAHELGHALLDAMRPDFWSVQGLEIWAFHEAYSDITSLVSVMEYKQVLQHALDETGGDLRKPNIIAGVAEHIGYAVYGDKPLRNAINDFKYVSPNTLPKEAPPDKLAAECHSFGRIFLGAWYDLLVGIYEQDVQNGKQPLAALSNARNVAFQLLMDAIPKTPRTVKYHEAISSIMTRIAEVKYPEYVKIWLDVMEDRNLTTTRISALSDTTIADVPVKALEKIGDDTLAVVPKTRVIKLADIKDESELGSLSTNGYNLANVELEVPADVAYVFNDAKSLVDEISPTEEEIVTTAQECVAMIVAQGNVSDESDTMWEVRKDKLVRSFIE